MRKSKGEEKDEGGGEGCERQRCEREMREGGREGREENKTHLHMKKEKRAS